MTEPTAMATLIQCHETKPKKRRVLAASPALAQKDEELRRRAVEASNAAIGRMVEALLEGRYEAFEMRENGSRFVNLVGTTGERLPPLNVDLIHQTGPLDGRIRAFLETVPTLVASALRPDVLTTIDTGRRMESIPVLLECIERGTLDPKRPRWTGHVHMPTPWSAAAVADWHPDRATRNLPVPDGLPDLPKTCYVVVPTSAGEPGGPNPRDAWWVGCHTEIFRKDTMPDAMEILRALAVRS